MSNVASVVNHFSTANEGFTTTTGSPTASGATSVLLTSSSGLTNGTIFVGIIEPGGTKQQVFTGTVDLGSNSITGVKWTRGTNVDHAAGVTVVDYVTGTDHNMMTKGLLVSHNQDGTLKNSIVGTANLVANAVTNAANVWNELSATTQTISTTGSYTDATGITGSFTSTGGDLLCIIEGSYYISGAGGISRFVLNVAGSQAYGWSQFINETSSHNPTSRAFVLTGVTAGAKTYKLQVQATATTTFQTDTNDYWHLTVLELKR
jgi:hypothetical protein